MKIPTLIVDFNEMLEPNLVLLSAGDTTPDSSGVPIQLLEGMLVAIYSDDLGDDGKPDKLMAEGVVERNTHKGWSARVKWCCRINSKGIRHQSEQVQ
jgi:hypothetical protein